MGTRGFAGFHVGGELKITYNHWDSYPSGLGVQVLDWLKGVERYQDWPSVRKAAFELVMVNEDDQPTAEQIAELGPRYGNPTVGAQGMANTVITTWYQLLRETQGDLAAVLSAGYMTDSKGFPLDSLFCEWGYLINLDGDGSFEVYEGFQKTDHDEGLWGSTGLGRPQDWKTEAPDYPGAKSYYPVRRVASWPLFNLPDEEAFIAATDPEES